MSNDSDIVEEEVATGSGWQIVAVIEGIVIWFLSIALSFLIGKVYF